MTNIFAFALIGALLAACATTVPPSSNPVAPYRATLELSGRLSINYQKDGKSEALSGKFTWQQSAARTDVSLASPLGQTIATIAVTPGGATLTQGGQPPKVASDIDALSAQALGWPLPVSGLRDWLQGYAVGADGSRFVASPRQDSVTTRDGWRLHFVSWQDETAQDAAQATVPAAARASQPKRIDAERSAGPQVDAVAIRIVIDTQGSP